MPRSKTTSPAPPDPAEKRVKPVDDIPLEARLRLEHAEQWVAWLPDYQGLVAFGERYVDVREAARAAGFPRAICEWVLPVPTRSLPE